VTIGMRARLLWLSLLALVCAQPAAAQGGGEEAVLRVEVRVTSVVAGEVYLDVGRDSGLETGDRVRLLPPGAAPVEVTVVSVSSRSARARLEAPSPAVDVGTSGEVRVPAARLAAPPQSPGSADPKQPTVPVQGVSQDPPGAQEPAQHPGWSTPPEEWNDQMPLLAPAQAKEQEQRAVTWRGFAFVDGQATFDDERDYALGRAGVDLQAQDLFAESGVLHLDLEGFARMADLSDGLDDDESRVRLDRLSYLWGGDRERPTSLEGGRFLQRMLPEFGVLDGVEWTQRLTSGDRLGVSAGFLPEWTPEMETGDDLQVAAAWRHLAGADDQLELGLGYQKTWHEGESDRDLALGTLDWRPDPSWNLHGTAWVDFYDSSEEVKSSGAELTQATLNASKHFSNAAGLTLFGTHMRYPDLLRYEYKPVEPTTLDDFENTRLGVSGWSEIARKVRLSARVSWWTDDEDDGLTGELRLGVRDRVLSQGELALALFGGDGKYSQVTGARLSASRSFASGWWTLGLESALHESDGFEGDQAELWQHVVRASFDRDLGASWDMSLWGDQRFGDEQQATTVGFSLRRRF